MTRTLHVNFALAASALVAAGVDRGGAASTEPRGAEVSALGYNAAESRNFCSGSLRLKNRVVNT
jgi:hypothetical protein